MIKHGALDEPLGRRRLIAGMAGIGALGAVGVLSRPGSALAQTAAGASCVALPEETAGPFPADGSNSDDSGVVDVVNASLIRRNIRADVDGSNFQRGFGMNMNIQVVDVAAGCTPVPDVYVYIWHANVEGEYSSYDNTMSGDNPGHTWFRGIQKTNDNGRVRFRTVYPARYQGRATHIHVAVFPDNTFTPSSKLITTQFSFPQRVSDRVYAKPLYASSRVGTVNADDNVFGTNAGGWATQLVRVTGNVRQGFVARKVLGI